MERFQFVRGSDVERDGMFLELFDAERQEYIAEVFYSDVTHEMHFTAYTTFEVPLETLQKMVRQAFKRLPPQNAPDGG